MLIKMTMHSICPKLHVLLVNEKQTFVSACPHLEHKLNTLQSPFSIVKVKRFEVH